MANITEKEWHTIRTDSPGDSTYVVYVDDREVASFNISSYGAGHFGGTEPSGNPNSMIPGGYHRSFAFGPWQDQAAWVRNVTAISRVTDKVLYENSMTSEEVLVEYGIQTNEEYVCSDAGKRDRYSWLGDRIISSRVTMVSTGEGEFVWGPADQALSRQVSTGQIPINTLFSPLDTKGKLLRTSNVDPLLVDYNFDFLQVAYDYWLRSGNDTFLDIHWQGMVSVSNYAMSRALDPNTQLYGAPTGPKGLPLSGQKVMVNAPGTANTVSMILGLERLADMAEYLGKDGSADLWRQQAQLSRDAIDRLLWNSTGGFYALNAGSADYDLMDIALALVGGIGTRERRVSVTKKLEALKVPAGYMNGTRFVDTPLVVDPYYLSFLLEGLAKENETHLAQDLLDRTWLPMVRQDANFTGAYWEYLNDDGTYPGLDLFSANSHFWGSYPTVFLTEYVLGVRPTKKGYLEFLFAPLPGFNTEWVHGRVPTPAGLIYAAWGYNSDGKIMMEIAIPKGLKGKVNPPFEGAYTLNGKNATSASDITGGQTITIVQL
ncbi:hypothetical protein NW768_002685 [Fusarium equiseti]|uniref:Uncharacterized protein n=1 Tax=Fusarium equiseti TaxID=61235 RepID=A0ABQ8RPN3_FUSEQ|nr:hypothetical protein NW768_002685 [Fusarium equiseti]